ncbi:MAG: FMN-binding protein [Elusimicrobiota bacterium]
MSAVMIRTLVLVATVCGLLIVTAFQVTAPVIAKNKAERLRQAVLAAVPGSVRARTFELEEGFRVHAAYGKSGELTGVALEAEGMGFQETIRLLYGYSPRRQTIVGMVVLDSKETPGLGDRIEKDPVFRANFDALDVRLSPEGELAHRITVVKPGRKENPWEIDAISGATISSKAIGKILDVSAAALLPALRRNLEKLEYGK